MAIKDWMFRVKKMERKNLIGQKFGKLLVIKEGKSLVTKSGRTIYKYVCKCECGKEKLIIGWNLSRGATNSCGFCLTRKTHGKTGSAEYKTWLRMKQRCLNDSSSSYKNYKGRGITISEEWKNSFAKFYQDMGERPDGKSIERIDNNGNYCKENCRWATQEEQCNNLRKNIFTILNGEMITVAMAAKKSGLKYDTLFYRVKQKWDSKYLFSQDKNIRRKNEKRS